MTKQEALPIRFFVGLFVLVTLVVQIVVIPRAGATYAEMYPEVAYLEPFYVSALVVVLIGLEIALLSAWQLVSAAVKERAPGVRPRRWSNIMAASLIFMAACFASVCVHAGSVAGVGGPAMLFGLLGSVALIPLAFVLRRGIRGWLRNEHVYALSVR
ncbi:hypothetical protein FDK12_11960 [Arthrobacter sp. NamB2]|uniref:hypothetical protein n=1 Tax=Arthrobacter sp. NamB2 TaxID=2576035 RepID=UPI0010C93812|nr:hypothetical protein [Arthrobacter sp. NamB2]TKV27412.1 hypothetical protein FDK12_11960 [Arthrobacter sp. NamB2]